MSDLSKHEDMIRQAKRGNIKAYEQLWQDYSPQLCTYLIRLTGNEEDARDIVQETFLKVWKGLPRLQKDRYFKRWLYKIATNEAHDHILHSNPKHWLSLEEHEQVIPIVDNGRITFEERVAEKVMMEQALTHVSPRPRMCMLLQIVGEFPQREIAEIMGIEVSHVSTYVKRGLVQLSKACTLLEQQQGLPKARRSTQ